MVPKPLQHLRDWICAPPYRGVPWLVWFYAVFCCAFNTHGGVWAGHLSGFDDHVRMVQVLDWINGHGWYDRTITRANPPEGFTTIWSRLVDIPIAMVILTGQLFTDQKTAALIASVVVPFAELAILFAVARYFARPLVGKDKARLIVLFLMFTTTLNYKNFSIGGFIPGEASHHSWYAILELSLWGAAARIALGSTGRAAILVFAGSVAVLLGVGVEGIPMIAAASALLAAVAWLDNRALVAKKGAQALALGAVGAFLLVPTHQPPAQLFKISFVEPSVLGSILVLLATAFVAVSHFAIRWAKNRKFTSLAIIGVTGIALLAAMIMAFPQVLDGPLAGISKAERAMSLRIHYESHSVFWAAASTLDFIGLVMPSVTAFCAGLIAIFTAKTARRRGMSIMYFGFATFSAIMAEDYSRYFHHAHTSASAWLLWVWEKIKQRLRRNRNYNLAALAIFVALGPLWMLLLPALESDAPILSQVMLYPAKLQSIQDPCDMLSIADYINKHYSKNRILIVQNWDSSRFLYYTDVIISFVANYPSQDKFIDNDNFFATQDPDTAKAIAIRRKIDLVAVCRVPLSINPQLPLADQFMLGRLQLGQTPEWLKPVDMGLTTNYMLYEVDKKALQQ